MLLKRAKTNKQTKKKKLSFRKTIGSNNYFTLSLGPNRKEVGKSILAYGQNAPSCDPLTFQLAIDNSLICKFIIIFQRVLKYRVKQQYFPGLICVQLKCFV